MFVSDTKWPFKIHMYTTQLIKLSHIIILILFNEKISPVINYVVIEMCFAKSILEKIRQLKFLHSLMHDNIFVFLRWSSRTWWHFCGNIYIWNIIRMMTFLRDMFLVSYLHSFPPIEFYHLNAVFYIHMLWAWKMGLRRGDFQTFFHWLFL